MACLQYCLCPWDQPLPSQAAWASEPRGCDVWANAVSYLLQVSHHHPVLSNALGGLHCQQHRVTRVKDEAGSIPDRAPHQGGGEGAQLVHLLTCTNHVVTHPRWHSFQLHQSHDRLRFSGAQCDHCHKVVTSAFITLPRTLLLDLAAAD